jgi:hypothetical protein
VLALKKGCYGVAGRLAGIDQEGNGLCQASYSWYRQSVHNIHRKMVVLIQLGTALRILLANSVRKLDNVRLGSTKLESDPMYLSNERIKFWR